MKGELNVLGVQFLFTKMKTGYQYPNNRFPEDTGTRFIP